MRHARNLNWWRKHDIPPRPFVLQGVNDVKESFCSECDVARQNPRALGRIAMA
jgi:hypothetical protein